VHPTPTLAALLDDAALLSLEHQIHLAEVVGRHNWNVDLQQQRFTFSGERSLECERLHLLGSAAPGPRSWLWAWANPSGFPPEVTALSAAVRDFGRQHGIAELTEPEVPFSALPGDPQDPNHVAGVFVEAAKAVTGRWTSYTGDAGGGTRAAFLLEHPEFRLPPPEPTRVMRVLQQSVAELRPTDWRRTIGAYAHGRGLGAEWDPDGGLTLTGPGLSARISFDGYGRVAGIKGSLSPTDSGHH
jgi:hypothetical protein